MKKSAGSVLLTVVVLAAYVLSACGAAPAAAPLAPADQSATGGSKSQAVVIAFTGTVESINGNQWVVGGRTVTVNDKSLPDANVKVGDLITVEGTIAQNGVIATTHIAAAPAFNGSAPAASSADPSAYPDPTETPGPQVGEQEIFGVIETLTDTTVTIGGVTYQLTNFSEVKGLLAVGDQVKIQFVTNPDGSLTIREIELSPQSGNDNGNGNENGNANTNDNSNGNGNVNGNSNDNGNGNVNSNDNGNGNVNSNDNGNGNDNNNDNVNSNDNSNENENSNENGNGNENGNNG